MNISLFWIQVRDLTIASLKSRYRKTWAGFVWVILNPLLIFGVQGLVFKNFLQLQVPNYYLFLLGGLLPWVFLSSTVLMGTPSLVSQAQLLKSFKIDPFVIITSLILDNFLNFLVSFFLILLPFTLLGGSTLVPLLLLPIALVPLLLGTMALTITLAISNVFFRDTSFVVGFIFHLLFFLTPIFYPKEFVPTEWHWLVDGNPLVHLIDPFRVLTEGRTDRFSLSVLKGLGVSLFFVYLSLVFWKRKRNDFYRKL